uniref:Uncharacterized protein n=1 Tax=Kalanchoe fedtschenkoi TaxID=63787 RepID=A0A7N1A7R9_KALFE
MATDIHRSTMESVMPIRAPSRNRRRILHTCAVSMLATADRASTKATMFRGPIGFLVNWVIQFVTIRGLLAGLCRFQIHLLLAILSFLDDRILKFENAVEDHFPLSSCVFDKIDDVVCLTESLPAKFDDAANKFSGVVSQIPPLSFSLGRILDWVNLLSSLLRNLWGSDVTSSKERDIMVDRNCDEIGHGTTWMIVCGDAVCQIQPSPEPHSKNLPKKLCMSDQKANNENTIQELDRKGMKDYSNGKKTDTKMGYESQGKESEDRVTKCSYKEVLEKGSSNKELSEKGCSYKDVLERGTKEELIEDATRDHTSQGIRKQDESPGTTTCTTKKPGDGTTALSRNDPILELFESSWHMT